MKARNCWRRPISPSSIIGESSTALKIHLAGHQVIKGLLNRDDPVFVRMGENQHAAHYRRKIRSKAHLKPTKNTFRNPGEKSRSVSHRDTK